MYPVSKQYKEAMKRPVRKERLIGTVNGKPFSDVNVLSGSFSINNQCSDETNVLIGQVYVSELRVTLVDLDAERYSLKDKQIIPYAGLLLEEGWYEDIPLGVFNITEANWGASGIEITAYDNMKLLDRSFSGSKLIGTPYVISELACKNCGLELGMSKVDFSSFVNGDIVLELYADNDIKTWRDVLSWVAQTCACNVFADRNGRIIFKDYTRAVTEVLTDRDRYNGSSFGDYETRYTGISVVDVESEMTKYIGEDKDDGLTYNLGTNPFMQTENQERMERNILDALLQILYVPFKVSSACDPAYDLMDIFQFSGGFADETKISCMTKFTYKYHSGFSMEGVGSNPALASGNSKSDKNIAGLMDKINAIESSANHLLYDYNTGPISIGQVEQPLGMITFYISEQADVEGHFLMSYHADNSTHLILRFYDTTVEELFSPVELDIQKGDGEVGIPHSYLHREVGIHSVYVTAQCTIGTIGAGTRGIYFTIDAGNFAESVDDISMDIMDISMRQLLESNGPDQIWTMGIEDGELLISRRPYSQDQKARPKWEGVYTPGKAKGGALEFDGTWVLRSEAEQYTLETEDQPWYFWIDLEDQLIAQYGDDESSRFVLDTAVKNVSACRGYSSILYPEQDEGLVVAYTKTDGTAWYRHYVYDIGNRAKQWLIANPLEEAEKWDEVRVHRLNDYRLSFTLSNERHNLWLLTNRTLVGQSVYPEHYSGIYVPDTKGMYDFLLGYYSADFTDPTVKVTSITYKIQEIKKDELIEDPDRKEFEYVFMITLDHEVFASESLYPLEDRISFNDSLKKDDLKKCTWEFGEGKTTVVVTLRKAPSKCLTSIYLNAAKSQRLRVRADGTVYPFECQLTATYDITNYITVPVTDLYEMKEINISLGYLGVQFKTKELHDEYTHPHGTKVALDYGVIVPHSDSTAENYQMPGTLGVELGYYQSGEEPV